MSTTLLTRSVRSTQSPDISIRVAATRAERLGAFRLTYQSYLRADLCSPCRTQLRYTVHQLAASTDIIVAELRGEVISTLSLVRDGSLGLPLESIYPDIVSRHREQGLRLAEVSCLADRRKEPARYFGLFCELAGVMIQMADREGFDQLLIAVHPRHAKLYCRAMAFQIVGGNCDYPAVNGNPAVPLLLDIEYVKKKQPQIWKRFAGVAYPDAVLERQPINAADRDYFLNLSIQSGCKCEAHSLSIATVSEFATA